MLEESPLRPLPSLLKREATPKEGQEGTSDDNKGGERGNTGRGTCNRLQKQTITRKRMGKWVRFRLVSVELSPGERGRARLRLRPPIVPLVVPLSEPSKPAHTCGHWSAPRLFCFCPHLPAVINDLLKQVLEEKENENPIERSNQTNKNWINTAKDWRKWALLEGNCTMTV